MRQTSICLWLRRSFPLRTAVVLLLWLGGLTTSCAGAPWRSAQIDSTVAEILWLPAAARLEHDDFKPIMITNGRSIYRDGIAAVGFSIESDPDELSTLLIQHFARAGWHQRRTQFLNPQKLTSFVPGWQTHYNGGLNLGPYDPTEMDQPYRDWHGEWTDHHGNLVEYYIAGRGRRLRGHGAYRPRQVVESMVQAARPASKD
jgi:hypothetical protein